MSPRSLVIAVLGIVSLLGCGAERESPPPARTAEPEDVSQEAPPVPVVTDASLLATFGLLPVRFESASNPINDAKVALGRMLYFDSRLSLAQDVSCNTCHDLQRGGVDGRRVSVGHRGQEGGRNAPTVYNAAGLVAQFWDGRAPDVEEQAKGPILNPKEMAMPDAEHVVAVVRSIPGYLEPFRQAFPGEQDPVTFDNLARAIGAFERILATPSRFDRAVAGETTALTPTELRGLRTFVDAGCPSCHSGSLVGGTTFQKLGLVAPYEGSTDAGRFDVTHQDADRGVFRVASLRNVAVTGPYFHDGKVENLPSAVRLMSSLQLGRNLTDEQVDSIVAFLSGLTGQPDPAAIQAPELPPSGRRTPRPPRS